MTNTIEDDAFALGLPTPEATYRQHSALLEIELADAYGDVQSCRRRIAKLVILTDEVTRERDALRRELSRLEQDQCSSR